MNLKQITYKIFTSLRVLKYKLLSTAKNVKGVPMLIQPTQLNGYGQIVFEDSVSLGVVESPYFFSTYGYIDARSKEAIIRIRSNSFINNNCVIISDGAGIEIGEDVLIGTNVEILDSDFHNLDPMLRQDYSNVKMKKIVIERNVFIGSNVTILKGVIIGINSVIANHSVVTKNIPSNVIAGGNPCKIIRTL